MLASPLGEVPGEDAVGDFARALQVQLVNELEDSFVFLFRPGAPIACWFVDRDIGGFGNAGRNLDWQHVNHVRAEVLAEKYLCVVAAYWFKGEVHEINYWIANKFTRP